MRAVGGYSEGRGAPTLEDLKGGGAFNPETMSLIQLRGAEEYFASLGGRQNLDQGAISISLALVRDKINQLTKSSIGGVD